ncbi:MAG: hypothetical protein LBL76_08420 [Treponema sp.]|nr:hypothetical protein [Treponema sp.]
MSYQRMTLIEQMDIFRLLYVERRKPSTIASALNRRPSSITCEVEKGMDKGTYNPIRTKARHLEARRNQRPRLKITDEAWNMVKPPLSYFGGHYFKSNRVLKLDQLIVSK